LVGIGKRGRGYGRCGNWGDMKYGSGAHRLKPVPFRGPGCWGSEVRKRKSIGGACATPEALSWKRSASCGAAAAALLQPSRRELGSR